MLRNSMWKTWGAQWFITEYSKIQSNNMETNKKIRLAYREVLQNIPRYLPSQEFEDIPDGERMKHYAKAAYEIRQGARLQARDVMPDKDEVAILQRRDLKKYGNLNGPDYEYYTRLLELDHNAANPETREINELITSIRTYYSASRTNEEVDNAIIRQPT